MRKTISVTLVLTCIVVSTLAQEKEIKAVVVPLDVYPLVVASQPICPLKIERVTLLKYVDGRFAKSYVVRNIGDRAIKSFTIAIWNSDNTGDVIEWHINKDEEQILPNQTYPPERRSKTKVVPLTNDLQRKLDLLPPMKKIVLFMVLHVEYSNGSFYDDRPLFDSLKTHLKRLQMAYESENR